MKSGWPKQVITAHHEELLQCLQRRHLAEGARGVPVDPAVVEDVLGEGKGRAGEAGQHDATEPADPLIAHQDRQPEEDGRLGRLLHERRDVDRGPGCGRRIAVADDAEMPGRPRVDLCGNEGCDARTPTERHQPDPEPLRPESVRPEEDQGQRDCCDRGVLHRDRNCFGAQPRERAAGDLAIRHNLSVEQHQQGDVHQDHHYAEPEELVLQQSLRQRLVEVGVVGNAVPPQRTRQPITRSAARCRGGDRHGTKDRWEGAHADLSESRSAIALLDSDKSV